MNDTERDCLVQGNSNRQSVKIQSIPSLFLTVFHAATEIDHVLEEELVLEFLIAQATLERDWSLAKLL
ncbi:unnamed protein product [Brassica rapa subsp. narinosa]